jgi:WD40-like Beta Propeller Repeat
MRMSASIRGAIAAAAVAGAAVPAAHADIFAVSDSRPPSTCSKCDPPPVSSLDIALVDLSTGARNTLPSSINTSTADEVRPSITPDGDRLVFLRIDGSARRVIMADLSSGQTSDLFNGFEAAARPPRSPAIVPDGRTVFTGGPFRQESGGFRPILTSTDVSSFPTGPYTHSDVALNRLPANDGVTDEVTATGSAPASLVAFQQRPVTALFGLTLADVISPSAISGVNKTSTDATLGHPTIGAPGGSRTIVYDSVGRPGDNHVDVVFEPATTSTFGNGAPITHLPFDTSANESRPAFTPDGRYLAFVRTGSDGHDRIFLWDSQTQIFVNSNGVDVGAVNADSGSPSLYTHALFTSTSVALTGVVSFTLLQPLNVGILVQRVVGHHKLFGRKVPKLKLVGRVPLGKFKKGHDKTHWNLKVNGKRLRPGTYQVTPRAVAKNGRIRDLGKPSIIRVKR